MVFCEDNVQCWGQCEENIFKENVASCSEYLYFMQEDLEAGIIIVHFCTYLEAAWRLWPVQACDTSLLNKNLKKKI